MQRILLYELTPEHYIATEAHRQVRPETVCPNCRWPGRPHRHGCYCRGITDSVGEILSIWIARFLCLACRATISYLPQFALSYRLVATATVEAFLSGDERRIDVQRQQSRLQDYRRRMDAFAPQLRQTIGCGLGRAPPPHGRLWPWLKEACGGLAPAARRLVAQFKLTLFKRYQCHQPAAG